MLAILLSGSIISTSAANASADVLLGREILSDMPGGDTLIYVYDRLCEGIASYETSVSISDGVHTISASELSTVYRMMLSDHPEFFYCYSGYGYSMTSKGIYAVNPGYDMTKDKAESAAAELDAAAEKLCDGLYGLSDYEISLALHDRVANAVDYQISSNDQNAYGALVEGYSVCAGYSAAYQYLMNKMGIPAFTVTGDANAPLLGASGPHAWNMVLLDGDWYLTDVTWDDQTSSSNHIFHEYFNTTDEMMYSTHIPDDIYIGCLPECSSDVNNYFVRNDAVITEFDAVKVANALRENNYRAAFYAQEGSAEFISELKANMSKVVSALNIYGSYSYSLLRGANEVVVTIKSDSLPKNSLSVSVSLPDSAVLPYHAELYRGNTLVASVYTSDSTLFFNDLSIGAHTLILTAEGCFPATVDVNVSGACAVEISLKPVGDLDNDGRLTPKDNCILKHIILGESFDDSIMSAADLDGNGYVNTKDGYLMKKLMAS